MAGMSPPAMLRKQKVVLSEEEAVRILEQARKGPFYVLYLLALTTGLREGELFALQWCDVNFDNAFLSISATLTEDHERELVRSTPKTKKSQRPAALCEAAIEALLELRRVQLDLGYEGEFVFTDSTGGPLRKSNFIRRIHGSLLAAAGLPKVNVSFASTYVHQSGFERRYPNVGRQPSVGTFIDPNNRRSLWAPGVTRSSTRYCEAW
jgi:integrase